MEASGGYKGAVSEKTMDVDAVLEKLERALVLQYRSALQYTIASGSVFGLPYQGLADRLSGYGEAELSDARRLVEKIVALGGSPPTDVERLRWSGDAREAVDWLIESETDAVDALRAVIPETGKEGRSEALEHLLEHLILRKQNQVDFLIRARREA